MQQEALAPIETYKISQFNEPYLHSVSRNTFEKGNAKNIFDDFFKGKLWEEDYLYIILGSDSGLLVDYIIEHGLPYGSRYIVIDLPNVIESIKTQLTFTKWDDKISLCTVDGWQKIAEDYKIQSYLFKEKVRYSKSIAVIDGFDPNYHPADTQVSLEIESIRHKTSVNLSRQPFIKRQIENLSENTIPVVTLKEEFEGKSCIILGGGPSLDDNIEWLKEHQNNLIIIGVSRVANKLLQDGITPHIVLSVDPHDVSFDVSKELLSLPDSVLFIHSNYCVPTLPAQWHGKSVYFGNRTPWKSKLHEPNIGLTGPTVTNTAISAAIELGFKQILLTGVDLSYASDGRTYASGSNEAEIGPVLGMKGQWVETYCGKQAETSTPFLHATYILAEQGALAKKHNCKMINLSPNAAKVENIEHIPDSEIVLDSQVNVNHIIDNLQPVSSLESTKANKQLLIEVTDLIKNLNEINSIAKQALLDNSALYKKYSNEEKNYKFKLKLDKAEKKLNSRFENQANFVKTYGIQHFIKSVQTDSEEEWSDEKMEETGRIYYQSFINTIDELKPLLNDTKQRLIARIEEEKASPNMKVLFSQWEKDKHFGRALNWKNNHAEKFNNLSPQDQQKFLEFIEKYHEIIKNTDTAHYRRTQKEASLQGVNRKALLLFQTNNVEGLVKLTSGLKELIDKEENARSFYYIAKGYLAALKQDKLEALESFEKVPDANLTEDEGLQITKLALELGQVDKAEERLKQLADLSDIYATKYAHLLRLNNKLELSIEVYSNYLEANNNDIKAWLELGKIYLEIDSKESAKMAFQCVLQIDPNNIEAKHLLVQLN